MRRALVIGIDEYAVAGNLHGCVADAQKMVGLLSCHGDGSENFSVESLLSSEVAVTEAALKSNIRNFFRPDPDDIPEVLCLYFAGHGKYEEDIQTGWLVGQDGVIDNYGVAMEQLVGYANRSNAQHVIIILDCCHAGAIDSSFATGSRVALAEGVCVLAGARDEETALEQGRQGVFTGLLAGALEGGAANPVTGKVTVAGLHAYVDGALGEQDQCPMFKANVTQWCVLRNMSAILSSSVVKRLPALFPDANAPLALDPGYEPTSEPKDAEKEAVFKELQQLRNASLIEPVDAEHLYYAAMEKKSCRLTSLGRYYWLRVKSNQFDLH